MVKTKHPEIGYLRVQMLVSAMFVRFFRTCAILRFDQTVFDVKLVNQTRKRNEIKDYWSNGFIVGNSKTSLMLGLSVRSMTRRSMP